jgi:hypothetical protein
VKVCFGALYLSLGQSDQLVENPSLVLVVATVTPRGVTAIVVTTPVMTALVVTAPVVTTRVVTALFQRCQLVPEHANPLRVALAAGLSNGFVNLALEPGVEPTVDVPLCVTIPICGRLLPALADPHDLLQILPLIEVVATRNVHRPRRVMKGPSLVVDRAWRIEACANRLDHVRTAPSGDHDRRVTIAAPLVLRIGLGHGRERQSKKSNVK